MSSKNASDVLINDEIERLQADKARLQDQLAEHEKVIQVQRAHQTLLQNNIAEHDKAIHEREAIMPSLHEGIQTVDKNLVAVRAALARKKRNDRKKRNGK